MAATPRFGAAAPAGQAMRQRRHPDDLTDKVQRCQGDLDLLLRDLHLGVRSARTYDDLEEQAQAIASSLVAAFRGPPRPVNPPLARTATGAWF